MGRTLALANLLLGTAQACEHNDATSKDGSTASSGMAASTTSAAGSVGGSSSSSGTTVTSTAANSSVGGSASSNTVGTGGATSTVATSTVASGAGGSSSGGRVDCDGVCEPETRIDCPEADVLACVQFCEAALEEAPQCADAVEAAAACSGARPDSDFECDDGGAVALKEGVCDAEQFAFCSCLLGPELCE
jgi:hypothetical protein